MSKWLVSLDTDKVKEYVFATGRLKEIRGASALLDELNRKETKDTPLVTKKGGSVIFAGGGSAIVEFNEKQDAKNFCDWIRGLYLERTGAASITGVIEQYDNDILDRDAKGSFHSTLQRLATRLQREKLATGHIPSALLCQPLWVRCERCGIYPATDIDYDPGGGTVRICSVCSAKRKSSKGETASDAQEDNSPTARFKRHSQNFPDDLMFPNELNELGNYIGLIYADGNGIGNFIRDNINTAEEMQVFSRILERAILDALEESTRPFWSFNGSDKIIPFLPIILGGDDILLITTGKIAMQVASQLCIKFQENMISLSKEAISLSKKATVETPKLFGGKPIEVGMSAGVIIAKSSFPLFSLEPLAAELLRSAKKLTNQLKPEYGIQPVIDFRVVSSPSASSLAVLYESEYRIQQGKWATCRPYPCRKIAGFKRPTWSDIEEAVGLLHKANFPRNKLHAWQNLLHTPTDLQAELNLSVIRAHLKSSEKKLMEEITGRLLYFSSALDLFTNDIPKPGEKSSPLPDIEEIYDYCIIGSAQ